MKREPDDPSNTKRVGDMVPVSVAESKTPWEVKLVVKKEDEDRVTGVEKVGGAAKTPWEIRWVKTEKEVRGEDDEKKPLPSAKVISAVRKAQHTALVKTELEDGSAATRVVRKEGPSDTLIQRPVPPPASWEESQNMAGSNWIAAEDRLLGRRRGRLVCLKNYAAVDASDETGESAECSFGLIDRGPCKQGVRALVMHSKSKKVMDRIRPGTLLSVQSTAKGGGLGTLRVRYTTPAKYYSPGSRVTTLCVGVDATDWHKLTTECRRI